MMYSIHLSIINLLKKKYIGTVVADYTSANLKLSKLGQYPTQVR